MQNQPAVAEHAGLDTCVVRRVNAECDLLSLHRLEPARYPHLLESAAAGTAQGRFDILFAFPGETLEAPRASRPGTAGFLDAFDRWWRREAVFDRAVPNLPFRGGWFVYLGYELAGEVEPTLVLPAPAGAPGAGLPTALATRIPAAVIRDRLLGQTLLVAESTHAALLDVMADDLARAAEAPSASLESHEPDARGGAVLNGALEEDAPARYLDGVRRVRDYILAGDVFQVNLSREWRGELNRELGHGELYARLRAQNPGPFAGLASWGDTAILSSSPERLVQVRGRLVQTRPIAGTRPRGFGAAADRSLSQ
ncbi:MAG: chorismate-binding protein, partial [Alphaproteobacteria bacterium]